jgi:hypothetical protein
MTHPQCPYYAPLTHLTIIHPDGRFGRPSGAGSRDAGFLVFLGFIQEVVAMIDNYTNDSNRQPYTWVVPDPQKLY